MNEYRPTRAAAWLGTILAVDGELYATQALREGAALGFSEAVVRGAFAEIRADASHGGQLWTLNATARQLFQRWAAAKGVPPLADREAYADFWKAPIAGSTGTSPAAAPAQASKPPPIYVGPPASEQAEISRRYAATCISAKQHADAATTAAETAPRIDAGRYRALRQAAIDKARGR